MPSTGVVRVSVLLGLALCHEHLVRQAQPQKKSPHALRRDVRASPLNDARNRGGGTPGLTDSVSCLGSESEVGALRSGTYWFAKGVNEITSRPRPASHSLKPTCRNRSAPECTGYPVHSEAFTLRALELSLRFTPDPTGRSRNTHSSTRAAAVPGAGARNGPLTADDRARESTGRRPRRTPHTRARNAPPGCSHTPRARPPPSRSGSRRHAAPPR